MFGLGGGATGVLGLILVAGRAEEVCVPSSEEGLAVVAEDSCVVVVF